MEQRWGFCQSCAGRTCSAELRRRRARRRAARAAGAARGAIGGRGQAPAAVGRRQDFWRESCKSAQPAARDGERGAPALLLQSNSRRVAAAAAGPAPHMYAEAAHRAAAARSECPPGGRQARHRRERRAEKRGVLWRAGAARRVQLGGAAVAPYLQSVEARGLLEVGAGLCCWPCMSAANAAARSARGRLVQRLRGSARRLQPETGVVALYLHCARLFVVRLFVVVRGCVRLCAAVRLFVVVRGCERLCAAARRWARMRARGG